jgi:pimeloyl-ACP methyl ester carboxylesterase
VTTPPLLLVPSFTELEWGIRPQLEQWAELASFDMPGVGTEPLPAAIEPAALRSGSLSRWRDVGVERAMQEIDRRSGERFVLVADSYGAPTAVRIARRRPDAVLGLALGHASLSHATGGERPPANRAVWELLMQLARQGNEAFVRYGIAQMTRGGIDEETAAEMLDRFPNIDVVAAMVEALGSEPEPIGDDLAAIGVPMLLAKHEGCLGRTDEGFEDIVAAFPKASTVICPEACSSSPAFANALREFCDVLAAGQQRPIGK